MAGGSNLALIFGAGLAAAVVIDFGVKNVKGAWNNAASTSSTPAGKPAAPGSNNTTGTGNAATTTPSGGTGTVVGDVTYSDLNSIAGQHGWSAADVEAWAQVIKLESNGTISDTNSSSGAYGIGQFLAQSGDIQANADKYYSYGGDPNSVIGQLTGMANYIAQRYGNPIKALSFHLANNWY